MIIGQFGVVGVIVAQIKNVSAMRPFVAMVSGVIVVPMTTAVMVVTVIVMVITGRRRTLLRRNTIPASGQKQTGRQCNDERDFR